MFRFYTSEPPAGPFFLFLLRKRKNRRRKRKRLCTAKEDSRLLGKLASRCHFACRRQTVTAGWAKCILIQSARLKKNSACAFVRGVDVEPYNVGRVRVTCPCCFGFSLRQSFLFHMRFWERICARRSPCADRRRDRAADAARKTKRRFVFKPCDARFVPPPRARSEAARKVPADELGM